MQRELKVKVCGMRQLDNIRELCALPVDFIGFIFYSESPRNIGSEHIKELVFAAIPSLIKKVGVFVNEPIAEVERIVEMLELDYVQLHGSESPEYCSSLKKKGIGIIKTFKPTSDSLKEMQKYVNCCNYFLFDTPTDVHGGSGKKFDWSWLKNYKLSVPFFISGGICPDDVEEIKQLDHPQLYGIDINSRFEIQPAVKNIELIRRFIDEIKFS